jgi:predicted ATP-grasp superfamily ATP-dependent carboligase
MTTVPDDSSTGALVLEGGATSLAVVRCLAEASINTIVVGFGDAENCKYSRCCRFVSYGNQNTLDTRFADWLVEEFGNSVNPLVLIPTSDASALFIAEYSSVLRHCFITWGNSFHALRGIISKDELYASVLSAGIAVPPYVVSPATERFRFRLRRFQKKISVQIQNGYSLPSGTMGSLALNGYGT